MPTMTFEDLPAQEQDEFYAICDEADLDPEDFNVSFTNEIAGDDEARTSGRSVVVQLGSIARAYEHDEELPWTEAFKEDVSAQVFGATGSS
ncbi:hypothetical protein [Caballeronia sordidicola]|uniref:Uncharacterized protein n=1 Tax=Caballeronia sordidicola TaxID=196367 RepID=A0A242NAB8_CABSO|nr:hypothetical protein [Caballeronia sordidicola]OTP80611.1 hypothetical protein PAMC26510_01345 [Caballeronia sordidicola]